jgi:hypothetical protein
MLFFASAAGFSLSHDLKLSYDDADLPLVNNQFMASLRYIFAIIIWK